jgi:hypothetical protein
MMEWQREEWMKESGCRSVEKIGDGGSEDYNDVQKPLTYNQMYICRPTYINLASVRFS